MTPPKPVGSGHVPSTGSVARANAARNVEASQAANVRQPKRGVPSEDQAPGPHHRRQENGDGREAEELRDEIGDDRARHSRGRCGGHGRWRG